MFLKRNTNFDRNQIFSNPVTIHARERKKTCPMGAANTGPETGCNPIHLPLFRAPWEIVGTLGKRVRN